MGFRVWKATTRDHPSLSKCSRSSAGVSAQAHGLALSGCRGPEHRVNLTSQIDKIIVLQAVDSFNLASDVELASGSEKVLDSGMCLIITTENFLGL